MPSTSTENLAAVCTTEGKSVPNRAGHCQARKEYSVPHPFKYVAAFWGSTPRTTSSKCFLLGMSRTTFNVMYDIARIQVFGIKGLPRISSLDGLNYSRCFLSNEMHYFLLGISKKTDYFMDGEYWAETFDIPGLDFGSPLLLCNAKADTKFKMWNWHWLIDWLNGAEWLLMWNL